MTETCNLCGKKFDIFDKQAGFTIVSDGIGYGSIHDGEVCNCRLCCRCFDRVMGGLDFIISPFFEQNDLERGRVEYQI